MRLSKGQKTAGRILDVAEAMFADRGFAATSVREIAEQVQIQQPGIYKHFASKVELYHRVYERALGPLAQLMDQALDQAGDDPGFDALSGELTDLLAERPNVSKLLLRAMIAGEEDPVGIAQLTNLLDYGRRFSERAGAGGNLDLLSLQIVSVFNVLFGYFWTAPLIGELTGKQPHEPGLLAIQKTLLRGYIAGLGNN